MQQSTSKQARQTTSTPDTKRFTSKRNKVLWKYYLEENNGAEKRPRRAICIECGAFIKRPDGSTTLMQQHLLRKHTRIFMEYSLKYKEAYPEKVSNFLF